MIQTLSDTGLVQAVAQAIARPKYSGGTSFTLHAPMELLARAALLSWVPPAARVAGRRRIAAIASLYAPGDEVDLPNGRFPNVAIAKSALITALRDYDTEAADAAFVTLASTLSAQEFCLLLADEVAASLGAAAHMPILLSALPDAAVRYGNLSILLRASIRSLATNRLLATGCNARLTWIDEPKNLRGPTGLWAALSDPPRIVPASPFIAPTMLAVEAHGFAANLLGRATHEMTDTSAKTLLQIAALSMLQDDPGQAPYGWSHCLTLPQGVLALMPYSTDPARLLRIAATHVLGFRATLGKQRLHKVDISMPVPDISALAMRAVAHPDAHLAKYTLACFTAAAADPSSATLFLEAARYLGDWWEAHPHGPPTGDSR